MVGFAQLYSSGLIQDYIISSMLAMEILQSCTKWSISCLMLMQTIHMYGVEIYGMTKQSMTKQVWCAHSGRVVAYLF